MTSQIMFRKNLNPENTALDAYRVLNAVLENGVNHKGELHMTDSIQHFVIVDTTLLAVLNVSQVKG